MFAVRANLFCVLWVLAAKSSPSSFLPRVAGEHEGRGVTFVLLSCFSFPIHRPIDFFGAQRQLEQSHAASIGDGVGDRRRGRHVGILRDRFAAEWRRAGWALD